jgi:site-specific DNA-methyltransferase (adenine-specific)
MELMQGDCIELLPHIPSDSIDAILTDPPYLYLKNQSFDKPFNETIFFFECKRVLKKDGFIALFGRGTSFYRWNTRLAELGFEFKEEIVWDKRYTTAPCIALSRIHETVSIHTKKTGKIRRAKVPYTEQKQFDLESVINDVKRIKSAIKTEAGLNKIIEYLNGAELYTESRTNKYLVTQQAGIKSPDRAVATVNSINTGMNERSIIHYTSLSGGAGTTVRTDLPQEDREIRTLRMIQGGMREKSVIELGNNHYKLSHPTEKPVRLAERIIALISDPGDIVLDPFMGSGAFGVAAVKAGRKFKGIEIIKEYFQTAHKRIMEELPWD